MAENQQQLEELFKQEHERDLSVIQEVGENLKKIFPDEKQFEVIFDIYQKTYKNNNDIQELNHGNIFLNSYIDAFYSYLVGEEKLISEDDFRKAASEAYQQSLNAIIEANKQLQATDE